MQTKMIILYGKVPELRGEVRDSGASPGGLFVGTPFASNFVTQPASIHVLEAPPLPPRVIVDQNLSDDD